MILKYQLSIGAGKSTLPSIFTDVHQMNHYAESSDNILRLMKWSTATANQHTTDQIPISYAAPLHLRRFGCWVSRRIPEPRRTDSKFGARSKPCTMVGYVHDSTTVWKIWDPEEGKVKTQSEVIFDEERNAYASCPPAYETEEQEEEEDIFGLKIKEPRQLEYIEEYPGRAKDARS